MFYFDFFYFDRVANKELFSNSDLKSLCLRLIRYIDSHNFYHIALVFNSYIIGSLEPAQTQLLGR